MAERYVENYIGKEIKSTVEDEFGRTRTRRTSYCGREVATTGAIRAGSDCINKA